MPLYEYRCQSCEHQFEVIRKFSDAPIAVCPQCGAGPVVKLLSSPAIQFKGSGWYITDYARKDSGKGSEKGAEKASEKPAGSAGSEAKETKSASGDAAGAAAPAATSTSAKD